MIKYTCILIFILSAYSTMAQWQALSGPSGATVSDLDKDANGNLYMVANGRVFKSNNNGDNWQIVPQESPSDLYFLQMIVDAGNFYALTYAGFYKSTDSGLNWILQNPASSFYGVDSMSKFGPDNYFIVSGWNGAFISKNAGVTWVKILSKQIHDIKANSAGDLYAVTGKDDFTGAQIIRHLYPGANGQWENTNWLQVYSNSQYEGHFKLYINQTKVYASVVSDLISSPSGDNGTWSSMKTSDITETNFIGTWGVLPDGTILFANSYTYPLKIYSSVNDGASWSSVVSPTDSYGSIITHILPVSDSRIIVGTNGDGIFRTDNGGTTWQLKNQGLELSNGQAIEVTNDGRILYINNFNARGYWHSPDNGVTWNYTSLGNYVRDITKLTDGKILIFKEGIYRSVDNGASFSLISPEYLNSIVEDASGNLFGNSSSALKKSVDQGTTWSILTITGLPVNYYIYKIAIDNPSSSIFFYLNDNTTNTLKIYKISTGGGAAVQLDGPWKNDGTVSINNLFISNNKLYASESNAFYESADLGVTWKTIAFSSNIVFPIPGGLCVSNQGSLYITQDGGKSWDSSPLPNKTAIITDIAPVTGGFLASALNSSALKFTGNLIVPPSE